MTGSMARLSEATGRTVIYNNLGQTVREPDAWKKHMARVEETSKAGIRAYPLCSPNRVDPELHDAQLPGLPRLADLAPDPALHPTKKSCGPTPIPAVRQKLHDEVIEHKVEVPAAGYSRQWYNYMWVETPVLRKEPGPEGQDHRPDRQGAEQAASSTPSSTSSSRRIWTPA